MLLYNRALVLRDIACVTDALVDQTAVAELAPDDEDALTAIRECPTGGIPT